MAALGTATPPATASAELSGKLGILVGLLVIGLFVYPAATFPQQALLLTGLLALLGPALVWLLRGAAGDEAARLVRALGSLPCLAGWGLAAWAGLRWIAADQNYAGRESVLGWFGFAAALTLGAVCGAVPLATTALRRVLALGAIGFALLAAYQYFISLPEALADYRAQNPGPVTDVMTQSMLYMLEQNRPGGRLGPTNLFAAQMGLLAVFALACLARNERVAWRRVGLLGFVLAAGAIVLTRSRGGMLSFGLLVAIGGAMLYINRPRRGALPGPRLPAGLILGSLALLHAAQAAAQAVSWGERLTNIHTIRERLHYWGIALKIWGLNPLAGAGPGSFEMHYLEFKPAAAREAQHAHNWLLELGCSYGAVGVGLALLIALGLALCLLRAWRRSAPGMDEAAWVSLAALVLASNGLFEFTLEWPEFRIALGLLIGVACALSVPARGWASAGDAATAASERRRLAWFTGGAALVSVGLLAVAVPSALATAARHHGDDARDVLSVAAAELSPTERQQLAAEALAAYRRAERFDPGNPAWPLAQAHMLRTIGRDGEAWPLLERAQAFNPRSAGIRAQQAQWLSEHGQPDAARAALDAAVALYDSSAEHRLARAELALRMGDADAARADLAWIEANPGVIDPYLQPRIDAARRALSAGDVVPALPAPQPSQAPAHP